jgi:hypothetical protein
VKPGVTLPAPLTKAGVRKPNYQFLGAILDSRFRGDERRITVSANDKRAAEAARFAFQVFLILRDAVHGASQTRVNALMDRSSG